MNMETKATPLDEQCKSALDHYNRISTEAMESHSLIPEAIESLKTLKAVKDWFRDWVKPWMHCLKEENDNLPISKKRINQLEIILKGREAQTITEDDVGNINEILG